MFACAFLVHLDFDTFEIQVQQQFLNDLTCTQSNSEAGTTLSCLSSSKIEVYHIGIVSHHPE